MTGDGFREKFDPTKRLNELRKPGDAGEASRTDSTEEAVASGEEPFSILSADRQQKVMLEFRFKNGNAKALAYSFLVAADFDGSSGIKLDFSGYEVTIAGRNLEPLFTGIVSQRVAVVREVDALVAAARTAESETVVSGIEIRHAE